MANGTKFDLFIAAPMSALAGVDYAAGRDGVLAIMASLSTGHRFGPIYFAGQAISGPEAFTGESAALRQDLEALRNSRMFVLVYPSKIVTSALVEVGYALALRLPCLLLVNDTADLPYLLNQAASGEVSDLLPPIRIGILREPDLAAAEIAAFRDDTMPERRSHG
jgi:hypothetical protein